ncbi:MAG: PleD family two-component system response regulator [Phycisphaerales bacterium]
MKNTERVRRVVVADDEHHIRAVVASKLRSAGLEVLEARDGAEALDLTLAHVPDLLITDLQMPLMSGLELCLRLKADQRTAALPVIMLTARGYILDQAQLDETNVRALMSKPFAAKELLRRSMEVLGLATQMREAA